MNTISKWVFAVRGTFTLRVLAMGLVVCLLTMSVYAASDAANTVSIHDENQAEAVVTRTNQTDAQKILAEAGIEVSSTDAVSFTGIKDGRGEISIDRSFRVSITAGGATKSVALLDGTVADALKAAGVTPPDSDDEITHALSEALSGGEEIVLQRVSYETKEVRETVPFEVEERKTPVLKVGKTELMRAGRDGTSTRVYTTRIVDGVAEEPELTKDFIEEAPVTEVRLVGANVPVSDLQFDVDIVNHAPVEYERVIKSCRATGYSAKQGAWGASGNHLFYGHVAVNPREIPYGSKLYIASPDGKFVYGYAIASDTGVALMNGVIDVDLYYETYRESQLNGVRNVNVYILNDDVEPVDVDEEALAALEAA